MKHISLLILGVMLWSQTSFAQTTVIIGPGANWTDNLVHSYVPNHTYISHSNIGAAAWTISGSPDKKRSLLKFNLSSIPAGATIHEATLHLYSDPTVTGTVAYNGNSQHSGSNAVYFEKVTNNWSETSVTWNNQPPTTTTGRIWFPGSTSTIENIQVDIKSFVQGWVNSPSTNYGMRMRLENEAHYRSRNYASEEHSNPDIKPVLVITYTTPAIAGIDCDVSVDSTAAVNQPYFNNNQMLLDLVQQVEGSMAIARTTGGLSRSYYEVPVQAWVYESTVAGDDVVTNAEVEQYINFVNEEFDRNNVSIHLYIACDIERIEDDDWYIGENWFGMFFHNYNSDMLNIHFADQTESNLGVLPYLTPRPYICMIETRGAFTEFDGNSLVHEIGHTLGLLHTHENARYPFGNENGKAFGCYQEYVDRLATLNSSNGCFFTGGERRCEVNGDMLCDTDADPRLTGRVTPFPGCDFIQTDPDIDFREDNDEDEWLTPGEDNALTNYMSYARRECRQTFTPMQRGLMYYYLENHKFLISNRFAEIDNSPSFYRNSRLDMFENDNYWQNSTPIDVNEVQQHTIHQSSNNSSVSCDEDWVSFSVTGTDEYVIQTRPIDSKQAVDTYIELYSWNDLVSGIENNIIDEDNNSGTDTYSSITITLTTGSYAIKIRGNFPSSIGFYSIEVSDECYDFANNNFTISGSSTLCGTETYSISPSLPPDYSISWTKSSNLSSQSGNTGSNYTVSPNSIGNSWVELTISGACNPALVIRKELSVHIPMDDLVISGPTEVCPNELYWYDVFNNSDTPIQSYSWGLPPGWTVEYENDVNATWRETEIRTGTNTGSGQIWLTIETACGTASYPYSVQTNTCSGGYSYSMYPNPVDDYLKITETTSEAEEAEKKQANELQFTGFTDPGLKEETRRQASKPKPSKIQQLKLYNNMQKEVKSVSFKAPVTKVDTRDLPQGYYILHIIKNNGIEKEVFFIQRE